MPRAQIATHQATLTLDQLHAELTGKVQANRSEGVRLAQSIRHVEAVLKLLDPSYSLRGISVRRRKPNPWFKRGTVWRSALDVLREAEGPLTAAEITARMLAAKGLSEPDPKAVRDLEGAVRAALRLHDGQSVAGEGAPTGWKIKPSA